MASSDLLQRIYTTRMLRVKRLRFYKNALACADDILEDYDDLEPADILAVLAFATRLTQVKSIYRVLQ
jgi:uncharacterized protein (DUF433 family)